MMDTIALDSNAAVALIAAAASSVSDEGRNESAWERAVMARAEALLRCVPALVERSVILAATKSVRGVIASVDEVKGRGVITSHATMGTPQRGQEVVNGRGVEHFRTAFLNTPEGQAMFALAKSLVGHHCRFGKRVEEYTDGGGQAGKVSMCESIEDLGPDPDADGSAPRPPARQTQTRPAPERAIQGEPGTDSWFEANGWRDKAQHDAERKSVTAALSILPVALQSTWREWAANYATEKGFEMNRPWPADSAMRLKARLNELLDEDEQRQMASVGVGPVDYGADGAPF